MDTINTYSLFGGNTMTATIGEYKGHKTIALSEGGADDKFPFSFGVKKAKLILAHIEDIKKFVEDNKE